jgi:methyltransferase OMS1
MGITGLREHLAGLARGHVLEVAVGTGRNLEYLDWSGVVAAARGEKPSSASSSSSWFSWFGSSNETNDEAQKGVQSYTGIDVSGAMLGVARDRVRENVPGLAKVMRRKRAEPMPRLADLPSPEDREVVVDALDGRVRLILGDALRGLPPPPSSTTKPQDQQQPAADGKYDTILQTFGLCSVPNPPALLAQMARHVRPETGRIYLLEHGRGTWSWINKRLDKDAADHFSKFGCWWNRDIEGIVRETAKQVPGLEVVKVVRPLWLQFGSVLVVELKVRG